MHALKSFHFSATVRVRVHTRVCTSTACTTCTTRAHAAWARWSTRQRWLRAMQNSRTGFFFLGVVPLLAAFGLGLLWAMTLVQTNLIICRWRAGRGGSMAVAQGRSPRKQKTFVRWFWSDGFVVDVKCLERVAANRGWFRTSNAAQTKRSWAVVGATNLLTKAGWLEVVLARSSIHTK